MLLCYIVNATQVNCEPSHENVIWSQYGARAQPPVAVLYANVYITRRRAFPARADRRSGPLGAGLIAQVTPVSGGACRSERAYAGAGERGGGRRLRLAPVRPSARYPTACAELRCAKLGYTKVNPS